MACRFQQIVADRDFRIRGSRNFHQPTCDIDGIARGSDVLMSSAPEA